MDTRIDHINPDTLFRSPAFSQAIAVEGPVRTVYVGGQDAVDAEGRLVGKGDLVQQTTQVMHNVKAALAAGGAGIEHVVKWGVYVVAGHDVRPAFAAFQEAGGADIEPGTVTMLFVAALGQPDYLIEVDAVAVVPIAAG